MDAVYSESGGSRVLSQKKTNTKACPDMKLYYTSFAQRMVCVLWAHTRLQHAARRRHPAFSFFSTEKKKKRDGGIPFPVWRGGAEKFEVAKMCLNLVYFDN